MSSRAEPSFSSTLQAKCQLAYNRKETAFEYQNVQYETEEEGKDLYAISSGGVLLAVAYKDIVNPAQTDDSLSFALKHEALKAYSNGETAFELQGKTYAVDSDGNVTLGGKDVAYISRFIVQAAENGVNITRENLPFRFVRWVVETPKPLDRLRLTSTTAVAEDRVGRPVLMFENEWSIRLACENNEGLVLAETADRMNADDMYI